MFSGVKRKKCKTKSVLFGFRKFRLVIQIKIILFDLILVKSATGVSIWTSVSDQTWTGLIRSKAYQFLQNMFGSKVSLVQVRL